MNDKKYLNIAHHYESCLEKYGDSHRGVDWRKGRDAETRYRIMLEIIRERPSGRKTRLLDLGCGTSALYDFIRRNKLSHINYSGLDISPKFIALSREKFPKNRYYCLDILTDGETLPVFDYIVMNGLFTEKRDLSFDEMFDFFKDMVNCVFPHARRGMAFNLMSKQVDWELKESFHMSFDILAKFLVKEISRNFIIRHDYGLYEYTVYLYR